MKRPASSTVGKRPAAKINETVAKVKRGVSKADLEKDKKTEEEETEEVGSEAEDHELVGRDKTKGQKYAKMKAKGCLPDHVLDLVEQESARSANPRAFKTNAINKLFVKDNKGHLALNLDDDLFQEHKTIYHKKYAKEEEKALPETIMRGLYFQGKAELMEEAKRNGDIEQIQGSLATTCFQFRAVMG